MKFILDEEKALSLWTNGYCFEAVGVELNCAGSTIKARVKSKISDGDREKQRKLHYKVCPKCYPGIKDQQSLF